jgi:UPF0755 protein
MNVGVPPIPTASRSVKNPWMFVMMGALMALCLLVIFFLPAGRGPAVRFQIRKGESVREVARDLCAQGLLRYRLGFLIWPKIIRQGIRPGVYAISPRETGLTIYQQLVKGPPKVRITFPEGWTSRQMGALLETRGICSATEFLAVVVKQKREGYLFPDTYFFEEGTSPEALVARMVDVFRIKVPKDFKEQAAALKLSYGQLITLASIVEREARVATERPLIAGVFLNRLRKHMHLESCATVEYSLGGWKPHLTYKDLEVESPYNTYRHAGLPPGPICNPGAAALDAAAHPAKTDMMFFVADSSGTHRFSKDYKEHLAIQKRK